MNNLKLKSMLEAYAKEREIAKKMLTEVSGKKIPAGEWDNEPDFLEFVDKKTNINCVIFRGPLGQLNGYIQIPNQIIVDSKNKNIDLYTYLENIIEVHGGVTYCGNLISDHDTFIGFDCGHWDDYVPLMPLTPFWISALGNAEGTYKNIEYVKNECKKVAMQLHNMAKEEVKQ